jgi:antitoxin VapB
VRARAKIFQTGRSQAVRLPAAFRFDTDEVYVSRDKTTGDVILSRRPTDWDSIFVELDAAAVTADDFGDRNQPELQKREFRF